MILWVDDERKPPNNIDYCHIRTVNMAIFTILLHEKKGTPLKYLDLDHDAGKFAYDGGDYIEILNWLERTGRNYPIRIHSMNVVGRQNMQRIIKHNGWTEIN